MTSLLKCPFCGATPHQGPGKKSCCQLHGDESQGWKITCPHGCAGLEMPSRELAMEKWNTRCASPVTEQVQPVAVTTHGQLDLIRRDDSGKMFPLDGYLHRSVEAIPLFTSPPDQSTQHFKTLLEQESARYAQACDDIEQWTKKFDAQAALLAAAARVIHSLGEMTGALETVLGLAYSKDGVKLGPDKGLEIKIARARSVLAKLHEVRG